MAETIQGVGGAVPLADGYLPAAYEVLIILVITIQLLFAVVPPDMALHAQAAVLRFEKLVSNTASACTVRPQPSPQQLRDALCYLRHCRLSKQARALPAGLLTPLASSCTPQVLAQKHKTAASHSLSGTSDHRAGCARRWRPVHR